GRRRLALAGGRPRGIAVREVPELPEQARSLLPLPAPEALRLLGAEDLRSHVESQRVVEMVEGREQRPREALLGHLAPTVPLAPPDFGEGERAADLVPAGEEIDVPHDEAG